MTATLRLNQFVTNYRPSGSSSYPRRMEVQDKMILTLKPAVFNTKIATSLVQTTIFQCIFV